jgi:hypothetical protein
MCQVGVGAERAGRDRRALACLGVAAASAIAGCGSAGTQSGSVASHASFLTGGTPGGEPVRGGTAVIDSAEAPKSSGGELVGSILQSAWAKG